MGQGKIVLLSGSICAGKSTLAQKLADRFGFLSVKTTDFVRARKKGGACHRRTLQEYGQRLDRQYGGAWLVTDFERFIFRNPTADVVVDSVRTEEQVEHFRKVYAHRVIHIHLTAPKEVLTERYATKFSGVRGEFSCYEDAQRNKTEKSIHSLSHISDIEVETSRCTDRDVFERAASLLGLYGNSHERLVDVLIGGQYGSEGKGNVAAYIAPEYEYLVRVGGPNAGHKVKIADGGEFTFRQLPSGTGSSNAKLVIGPGAVVNPSILMKEVRRFKIGVERLFIDPQALVISPSDRRFEMRSLKGDISSTASGAGKAAARRIMYRGSPAHPIVLARDHEDLKSYVKPALEVFDDAFRNRSKVFLEGTQGTGLSLYHGYYPHVTSRDTTVSGCLAEAGISAARVRKIVMVCRTYPIRVPNSESGNTSGPMSPNVTREEIAERSGLPVSELAEITSVTKGKRRIGEFDWHLLRKSTALNSPTDVALTFADYLSAKNQQARRFEQLTKESIEFIEEVERFAKAPVSLISTRFHMRSIIDRRAW